MTVFPVVIDARPKYLAPGAASSLALLPYGTTTILGHVAERVWDATRRKPMVFRTFEAGDAYDAALAAAAPVDGKSLSATDVIARIAKLEPSDWVLLVNVSCFPAEGFDLSCLFQGLSDSPRIARHLLALDRHSAGTNERVEFDATGRVSRVQRYYDAVTWTVATGIACSLVPVSSLSLGGGAALLASLWELRRDITSRAMPSRDVPMNGTAFDLGVERGFLRLNQRAVRRLPGGRRAGRRVVSRTASVHPSARLVGPVVIQDGATIEAGAALLGPAVVGPRAHVQAGAVVAQSVVSADTVVPAGVVIRHRIVDGPIDAFAGLESAEGDELEQITPGELVEDFTPKSMYPAVKTAGEIVIAAVALVVLSPLMLLIALLIKLESRGPVLYGDPREAKNGRMFRCFKFRSMFVGADAAQRDLMAANQVDGPQFKLERDPRITRLGRFLRALSLDELPQLINVARGEMSLVGPRPSPFRENQQCVPWRDARLSVRPGITGLWQVCRHDRSSGDFHQWIYYDIKYVRNMSLLVDLKILCATVFTLGGKGHVPLSWIISSPSREGV